MRAGYPLRVPYRAGAHFEVPLTRGLVALVDECDVEVVSQRNWTAHLDHDGRYSAHARIGKRDVYMHRVILSAPAGRLVDHANGDSLDNRRQNIRLCDVYQNRWNSRVLKTSQPFKGIRFTGRRWGAHIQTLGRKHNLGLFDTAESAARAYDEAAIDLFGDFARINFPMVAIAREQGRAA